MDSVPSPEDFAARCAADGEMRLAVRHWTGGLRIEIGERTTGFMVADGQIMSGVPGPGAGVITLAGNADVWAPLLESVPPPFATLTVMTNQAQGISRPDTDPLVWWQYTPAVERAVELLRPEPSRRETTREPASATAHDSPVGRYVHLDLGGVDYRVYYEEAGDGIPLLLQHTAGSHSVQYRHLFENPAITEHFRLIAYDLPFHGKSIPPVDTPWWQDEYRLQGEFLRSVPTALADALDLDRPVFMGCSVGGLLALDLALHHPDRFRAVISLEGALTVSGDWEALDGYWHPQVSNTTKARIMESLCAPTSPECYVKEVSFAYSAGWPPVFLGDLWYYLVDHDITDRAHEIDTSQVAVHILNGEYDWSGHAKAGLQAHQTIAGSTHTVMAGIGHFPMQENPVRFSEYLLPVLDEIRALV